MTRGAALLTVLVFALALIGPSTAGAVRSEFFGIVQGQFAAEGQLDMVDLEGMRAARVRTDRFELGWRTVEPTRGERRWGAMDQFIGALASHGIRAVPFIWGSPSWVASSPGRPPIDTAGHERSWRTFLKAAVARYGPGGGYWRNHYRSEFGAGATPRPVEAWQIWNEPNLKKFFDPEGTDAQLAPKYARLLRISHDAITSQDPNAKIVLAGNPGYPPSGGPKAWEFLDSLYDVPGIKGYFDAAALHPYASDLYHVQLEIQKVRSAMDNHNDHATPLWITELGWGSAPRDRFGINQGPEGQRQLLTGAYNMILSHRNAWNVQRLFWFLWRDPDPDSAFANRCSFCGSAGLLRYDRTGKPAFGAFKGFVAETQPPTVTIPTGPGQDSFTNNAAPTFTLASNEPGSTFECHVDATPFEPCGPRYPVPRLSDGVHTFFVRATDAPGNVSQIRPRRFTVDTQPPPIAIASGPANGSATNDQSVSFSFGSSDSSASLSCQLDGGGFAPCSSPFTRTGLADGAHTFKVKATDAAGNNGQDASTWTVDTVAPTVTITAGPGEGATSPDPKPSFGFSASEPGVSFQCQLDGSRYAPCNSPHTTSWLLNSQHSFDVRAIDRAGNPGQAPTRTWTVHAEVMVRIISGLEPNALTNDPTPGFRFASSYPGATFRCRIDDPGGAFEACTSPFTPSSPLPDGPHTFTVKAVSGPDQSQPKSRSFTVDTRAPSVSFSAGPRNGSTSSDPKARFSFSASEPSSRFQCRLDSHGFAPCSSPHATHRLRDGRHRFRVRAIDAAGNRSGPHKVRFKVDTAAPRLRIKGSGRVRTRRRRASAIFTLRASERAGLRCRIGSTGFRRCSRRYRTPKLGRGPHTLVVKATDRAGNVADRQKRFRIVGKR